jgi:DNA-directed RNA polymerase specialized sigma subunit
MREKKDRNKLIYDKIMKGEYAVDIAKEFGISESMVSKLKRRYIKRKKP